MRPILYLAAALTLGYVGLFLPAAVPFCALAAWLCGHACRDLCDEERPVVVSKCGCSCHARGEGPDWLALRRAAGLSRSAREYCERLSD